MNSRIVKTIDNGAVLQTNMQSKDILESVEEQYGSSEYGSVKYTHNEMYWIGYLYRYFSYSYGISSLQAYKIVKPKELRGLFLPYHTMSPEKAIERIINLFIVPLKLKINKIHSDFDASKPDNSVYIPAKEVLSIFPVIQKSREQDKMFGFRIIKNWC